MDFPQIFSSRHAHPRNSSFFLSWVFPSHRLIDYVYFIPPPCFLILSHSLFICLSQSQLCVRFRSEQVSPGTCRASGSTTTSNTPSTSLAVSLSLYLSVSLSLSAFLFVCLFLSLPFSVTLSHSLCICLSLSLCFSLSLYLPLFLLLSITLYVFLFLFLYPSAILSHCIICLSLSQLFFVALSLSFWLSLYLFFSVLPSLFLSHSLFKGLSICLCYFICLSVSFSTCLSDILTVWDFLFYSFIKHMKGINNSDPAFTNTLGLVFRCFSQSVLFIYLSRRRVS